MGDSPKWVKIRRRRNMIISHNFMIVCFRYGFLHKYGNNACRWLLINYQHESRNTKWWMLPEYPTVSRQQEESMNNHCILALLWVVVDAHSGSWLSMWGSSRPSSRVRGPQGGGCLVTGQLLDSVSPVWYASSNTQQVTYTTEHQHVTARHPCWAVRLLLESTTKICTWFWIIYLGYF